MTKAIWLKLLLILSGLAILFIPLPVRAVSPMDRILRIEAESFAYSPSQISVNPGDRITIELVSTDVVHGLYVDGYGVSLTADPGQTARMTFVADQSGSFRFRCNVTCGALHPFMIGRLNVGGNSVLYRSAGLAIFAMAAFVLWPRPAGST